VEYGSSVLYITLTANWYRYQPRHVDAPGINTMPSANGLPSTWPWLNGARVGLTATKVLTGGDSGRLSAKEKSEKMKKQEKCDIDGCMHAGPGSTCDGYLGRINVACPGRGCGDYEPVDSGTTKGSDHYKHGDIEPIDYIFAQGWGLHFCFGSVLKYITRYEYSQTGDSDLAKAIHYLEIVRERGGE
jgi:hypothetical protein